jgi:GntP family gluconate:H+ symporter
MNVGIAVMATGLVGALQLTHAIVPPTPGPLAAAALLGADIGKTIIFGSIACLFGSISCWLWGAYIAGPRIRTLASDEFDSAGSEAGHADAQILPSALSSYAPIAIPVLLIGAQSVVSLLFAEGHWLRTVFTYLGWPVLALSIGVWLAYRNITSNDDKEKSRDKWVEAALRTSAMILVVTGLGGSLSAILRGTPAVEFIAGTFTEYGLPTILLPFVIGVIGNMITGSTTVGVITAASLVAPMLGVLNLSPEAAMLSGASGSVIIKYVNSSYFWVCTSLSRLSVADAVFCYGGATLVGGLVSFAVVCTL